MVEIHHGWERSLTGDWRRVVGCEGSKGDCWDFLARRQLETVGLPEDAEYQILPAGERPKAGDYLTRELRGRR